MTSNGKNLLRQRSTESLDELGATVTKSHKSIWIKKNFEKRECSRFIPKKRGQDICSCGKIKELHSENSLLPPALQDSVWVPSRHTVTSPTDAYGEIEFHGAGHYSRAKFIRLSHDTDPELAYDLLCNEWDIGVPKLLISVTGGAKNFVIQPKLKQILRHGLLKAAQITGAWLITGGTNTGVMKHIGEAVRGHTVMSRGAQLKDRAHKVHLIGIASWGIVNHREKLVDAQEVVAYHMTSSLQSSGACLDNNHSHFILVDNGTIDQYGVEISFRANLENCIARKTMLCEKSVPVVLLVLEGGPNTIRTVLESVTKEPSVPVVIAEGSGRAADILAFAHKYIGPAGGEMSDVGDVVEHRQLLYKIEKAFPEVDRDTHFTLYQQVLTCVAKREFITVFCVDEGDMDKAILRALLKGQRTLIEDQLNLALIWNRPDIAKSEIFSEDHKWKSCELEKTMMSALQYGHVDFVELLLENGVSMSHFLTEKRLGELYKKTIDASRTLKFILQKCKVTRDFRLVDLCTITDYLVGLSFRCVSRKQDSFIKQSMSVFNAFVFSPATTSSFEPTVRYKFPFKELMVWAVLCNRQKMARFMWERGEDNLAKALIAGFMLKAMAKEMSKDDLLDDLCDGLEQDAKYFYDLAVGILDECFRTNEATTDKLLTYHLDYWGGQTNLSLAVAMKHKEFVAHSSCQSKMTEIWMGAIRHDTWSTFKVVLGLLCPPILFTLDFKSRKEMSSMPCTFEEHQAEQVREMTLTNQANHTINFKNHRSDGNLIDGEPAVQLRTLRSTCDRQELYQVKNGKEDYHQHCQHRMSWARKFYEFHRAPITKFWANLVLYIIYFMFLALFSYIILLKLEPFPKLEEWILIGFVLTLLLEEIRQIVQSEPCSPARKIKEWASNNWNICDGIAIILFFVGVGLRFHPETLHISHVIYSVDIMLWIIRLLDIFSVNKNLGPYVVMIGRMTVDMAYFLLIMVVFLLAYGVAQQAILFPNQAPTWELIPKIFFRPYFQVYGELFIEDVEYANDDSTTAFGTPKVNVYAGRLVTIIMAFFLLVANILLLNLLIAIFNNTFEKVQANANQIWKFQRYELIMEYSQRPLLVPPFIVFAHIYRLLKYCCKRKAKGTTKSDRKLKLFLCKDELYKLMLFEEQCTESYLQRRAKKFHSTQEERVRGIADRVESNAGEIDKLSKTLQSVDDRCSKLEEYTLQILDVVGHLQLSIPVSISECEGMSRDCDEQEMSMGQYHEGNWSDRYTIQNESTAPALNRMISMPAYMHQKIHSTGPSGPLYFRNKLPLTNPYQYRQQFNSGAHAAKTSLKKAISRFRRNTLPRDLPERRNKRSTSNPQNDDNEDGASLSSSVKSNQRLRKADSTAGKECIGVPQVNTRPRSSSMPSCYRDPNEYFNISRDQTLHIRARQSPYPHCDIHRYPVPDFLVDWQMPFPGYFPVNHSDTSITTNPSWADVDISDPEHQDVHLRFNSVDNDVDRRSHIGFYDLFDGLPRNPMGRTGLGGRGLLGRWGPNHAADPIVTRWMKNGSGEHVRRTGKRVLEFVAVQRRDCKQWAIPGGMIDVGETVSQTLKREFCEEALCSLEQSEQEIKEKAFEIQQFFAYGIEIYKGYVDDPRNTDNAWMETVAINFHDETGNFLGDVELKEGDDACNVRWQEVSSHAELYANHAMMLQRVAEYHGAYF